MTNANECTCPSGDGSLRHPCPAHPVSVEQAGGDERAAFFKHLIGRHPAHETEIVRVVEHNHAAWKAWQARAALAQPSPVRSSLLINGYQLRAALEFIAPDGTAKQLESEARIEWRQQDADFLEAGLYAWCAEYPEECCVLLDDEPTTAQPSPAPAEQAEAERPEVVARVVHSNPVVLDHCGPLNANDELMTVAQHAASVARWAEMFNRVEQERDAALAEVERLRQFERICEGLPQDAIDGGWTVQGIRCYAKRLEDQLKVALARVAELESKLAELEKQDLVDVPGPDEIHQMAFEEGQPAEDGDGYLFSAEEFDLFVQRLLDSCATPVAWAQHSVPEGWMLVECGIWTQEQVDEMQKTVTRFRNSEFVDDRALAMAVADAGQCKAPEISLAELLAAAPVCRLSRSALTDAQMRRLYENSTETENERLGFEAFARLIRRAEAVHQITAAPGKEGV